MAAVAGLLLAAVTAAVQSAPIYIPYLPYQALTGPRDLCTEFFSVRLEAGETLAWRPMSGFAGGISYLVMSGGRVIQIDTWPDPPRGRHVRLPLSPITEERVRDMRTLPNLREPDGSYHGPTWRIIYLLHGSRRQAAPVSVGWYTNDRTFVASVVRRVTPGTMAERNCRIAARLDPALAGAIGEAWPFGGAPRP